MERFIYTLFIATILIPVVVALQRLKKIDPVHYPFLLYLGTGTLNEILSFFIIQSGHSNAVSGNIYYLLASLIIISQFWQWRLIKKSHMYILLVLQVSLWSTEMFILGSLKTFASHYIVTFSSIIVLLSISMINQVMSREKQPLHRNPVFLICTGFILFFTCSVIVETAYIYSLRLSRSFQVTIFKCMLLINFSTNLIYTRAILWMPRRRRFSFSF